MGQNIGTGGRAWGKILGRCVEYTGVGVEYSTLKEPMLWIYKIVGVKKQNGSPCRTVEMQRLNNAPLCLKKNLFSPLKVNKDSSNLTF